MTDKFMLCRHHHTAGFKYSPMGVVFHDDPERAKACTMFQNRKDAGEQLAKELLKDQYTDPIVLALPRGGVPVAYEVAKALAAPLDLILVKKIGVPFNPELAVGAIVEGNPPQLFISDVIKRLAKVEDAYIQDQKALKLDEIARRRALYFKNRPNPQITGRDVILVDDGVATGSTMRAAIKGLKAQKPKRVILAIPVAPEDTLKALSVEADKAICLDVPSHFYALGSYYVDFHQLGDDEVIAFLNQSKGS